MSTFTTPEDLISDDPRVYSDTTALALAEHSVAVYQSAEHYGFDAMAAGFTGGTVIARGPAQVGVAWSPKVIQVTPRGSDQPRDWLGNFASVFRKQWRPILPRGCRVGVGFLRQANQIAAPVLAKVLWARQIFPGAKVTISGHSLGAALVPLLVAYFKYHGVLARVAYMLEPPRPGNGKFARWYDAKTPRHVPTYNVTNVVRGETDLVTRVPLRRHGARHVGQRVVLADGERYDGYSAWRAHRAANPVGYVAAWRAISKAVFALRAHSGELLLETLRRRLA